MILKKIESRVIMKSHSAYYKHLLWFMVHLVLHISHILCEYLFACMSYF